MLERSIRIWNVNLKFNLLPYITIVAILWIVAPLFIGIENLNPYQVAKIAELFLGLLGIILLIPVYMPDVDKNIVDLVGSKKMSIMTLYGMRIAQSTVLIGIFTAIFLLMLKHGNCSFSYGQMFYTVLSNSFFLGGMGMLIFSVFNQIAFAYMVPIFYYMACYGAGKKYLGNFYLFTMQYGSFKEKHFIIVTGFVMMISSVVLARWLSRFNKR